MNLEKVSETVSALEGERARIEADITAAKERVQIIDAQIDGLKSKFPKAVEAKGKDVKLPAAGA